MSQARDLVKSFFSNPKILVIEKPTFFSQYDWDDFKEVACFIGSFQGFKDAIKNELNNTDLNEIKETIFERIAGLFSLCMFFNYEIGVLREALGIKEPPQDKTPSDPGQAG